jgi:hypothetical protein
VLGQVQSPDLDDWSEKVYRFQGKPPRYFDLLTKVGMKPGHLRERKRE